LWCFVVNVVVGDDCTGGSGDDDVDDDEQVEKMKCTYEMVL